MFVKPKNREQEVNLLTNELKRYDMQAALIKFSAFSSLLFALSIAMSFALALLLILLMWLQESIWRTDQSRINARLQALDKANDNLPDYSAWKSQRIPPQQAINDIKTNAMLPKVGFSYIILFGIEMTIFGMGFWPS
jgi:hypothetical protein